MKFSIDTRWARLEESPRIADEKLVFPLVVAAPGVYRLFTTTEVYIGEALNLRARFGQYRNPGGSIETKVPRTNRRVNRWILEQIHDGCGIGIEICTEAVVKFDDGGSERIDLRNRSSRLIIENLTIERDRRAGLGLVNL